MSQPIDRRNFLQKAWRWGAGLIGLAGAWTSWDLLQPNASAASSGPVKTLPPSAIPDNAIVEIKAIRGYLTRQGDQVVALAWKCPHLGCRVPWCDSAAEFECPCHGSVFNRLGEYREGPSPRGMDRYPVSIVDGFVVVDPSQVERGPAPGPESIDEPPIGPRCVEGAG